MHNLRQMQTLGAAAFREGADLFIFFQAAAEVASTSVPTLSSHSAER